MPHMPTQPQSSALTRKSELLSPAGSFEKLQVALLYGADAVYLGTPDMSLRSKSAFSLDEVVEGVKLANNYNKRVYLTLNLFAHNKDIAKLDEYVSTIQKVKPHGAEQLYKNGQVKNALNVLHHCFKSLSSIRKFYIINNDHKQHTKEYELSSADIQLNCAKCLLELDSKNNSIPQLLKEARRLYIKNQVKSSKKENFYELESLLEKINQHNQ